MPRKESIENVRIENGYPRFEYKDYTVTYYFHSDEWRCHELRMSSSSLPALKARIDKVTRIARDLNSVPLLKIDYNEGVKPVVGVMRSGTGKVWCMVPQSGNKAPARVKLCLNDLALDTPDNRKLMAEYDAARKRQIEISQQIDRIKSSIPRAKMEDLDKVEDQDIEDETRFR